MKAQKDFTPPSFWGDCCFPLEPVILALLQSHRLLPSSTCKETSPPECAGAPPHATMLWYPPSFPWADWGLAGTPDLLRFSSTSGNLLLEDLSLNVETLDFVCFFETFLSDWSDLLKLLGNYLLWFFTCLICYISKFRWNWMWKGAVWSSISLHFKPVIVVARSLICVWCRRPWSDDEECASENLSWGADGYRAQEIMSAPSPLAVDRAHRQTHRNQKSLWGAEMATMLGCKVIPATFHPVRVCS